MRYTAIRFGLVLPLLLVSLSGAEEVPFSQLARVLRKRCLACHNLEEARGGLNLASSKSIEAGSTSGPVIVPGKPNESLLYRSAAHLDDPKMPPNSQRISDRELDVIRRWILGLEAATPESPKPESPTAMKTQPAAPKATGAVRPLLRPKAVTALASHPTAPIAAVAGEGQALIVHAETGEILRAVNVEDGDVTRLRFSPDGTLLLIAYGEPAISGRIVAVNAQSGEEVFRVADELDSILAMDIAPNNRWVATGGPKRLVRIYDVASGKVLHTLRKHTDWVLSLAFSPDGLLLATGDRFGGAFVWDPESGELFQSLESHAAPIPAMVWGATSETLFTGAGDGAVRAFEMHGGERTQRFDARSGPVLCMARRQTGELFVGGRSGKFTHWSADGKLLATGQANDQVESLAIAGDSRLLVGDAAGELTIRDLKQTSQIAQSVAFPLAADGLNQLLAKLDGQAAEYAVEMERQEAERAAQLAARESEAEANATVEEAVAETRGVAAAFEANTKSAEALIDRLKLAESSVQATLDQLRAVRQDTEQLLVEQSQLLAQSQAAAERLNRIEALVGAPLNSQTIDAAAATMRDHVLRSEKLLAASVALQQEHHDLSHEPSPTASTLNRLVEQLTKDLKQAKEDAQVVESLATRTAR